MSDITCGFEQNIKSSIFFPHVGSATSCSNPLLLMESKNSWFIVKPYAGFVFISQLL